MKFTPLKLPEVMLIEPDLYLDDRGYFYETYNEKIFRENVTNFFTYFVQDNNSYSNAGTIRGIHFQLNPKPQAKLVRCTKGKVLDVVVDLRSDSDTFKDWISIELSDENKKQIWIPNGFGHGFLTLTNNCEIQYKVDEFYSPKYDSSIAWNDPDLAIDWGISDPIVSLKDANAPALIDSDVNFTIDINN